jgi:NADP-dependent 3-hydroxy acid dehydrogenase YdfG
VRILVDHLDDDAGPQALGAVLARSAAELADLAERTERLQDVMAALVRQCAALDVDATQDMQALDWIAQHLEGMAGFLDSLSKAAGPAWRIDPTAALDALSLAELAHRLRGTPVASAAPLLASGEMELF